MLPLTCPACFAEVVQQGDSGWCPECCITVWPDVVIDYERKKTEDG